MAEQMQKDKFIFDDIPFQPDISELEKGVFFYGDLDDENVISAWEKALQTVHPKAIVACVDVNHDDEGKVVSIGGQPVSSTVLDYNLEKSDRAFAFIATCGTEIKTIDSGGDLDVKAALLEFRLMALKAASSYAIERVQEYFDIKSPATMNPGSLPEWPITEQPKIFAMLGDVEKAIGVTLGTNMFMIPVESSSGIIFETEREYKNCMLCTRLNCINRQAKYDEVLASRFR